MTDTATPADERAIQTQYEVTYERVGRRGGRNGTPPPALTVWAASAGHLAELVHTDIRRGGYLASRGIEVAVDLERMRGFIFAGLNNGGSFTIRRTEDGDDRG